MNLRYIRPHPGHYSAVSIPGRADNSTVAQQTRNGRVASALTIISQIRFGLGSMIYTASCSQELRASTGPRGPPAVPRPGPLACHGP
ncbi:hypothetical protein RRG08_016835 [Elysia crispata]|uniref:Uncharacterized protein n=1 Tax=Elysia crispata TaxID=231223 RepID=A0AAE0Z8M5_9GAST|nr:hypothetical protein RRG08_016835 [Elysia crispata]